MLADAARYPRARPAAAIPLATRLCRCILKPAGSASSSHEQGVIFPMNAELTAGQLGSKTPTKLETTPGSDQALQSLVDPLFRAYRLMVYRISADR